MKRATIIILMLTGLYACTNGNKQGIKPEPGWGTDSASVIINDSIWPANAIRVNFTNDTLLSISIEVKKSLSNGQQYSYEELYFKMVRKATALQKLDSFGSVPIQNFTSPEAKFFTIVDVDALNEIFYVYRADSLYNWIQITDQEDEFKKISGRFNVTLIKSQNGIEYRYPDTIRIRNGYFRVTMKE